MQKVRCVLCHLCYGIPKLILLYIIQQDILAIAIDKARPLLHLCPLPFKCLFNARDNPFALNHLRHNTAVNLQWLSMVLFSGKCVFCNPTTCSLLPLKEMVQNLFTQALCFEQELLQKLLVFYCIDVASVGIQKLMESFGFIYQCIQAWQVWRALILSILSC